jgi:RHS repeat-associated protein
MALANTLHAKETKIESSFDYSAINTANPMVVSDPAYNTSTVGTDCNDGRARVALVVDRAYSNPLSLSHPLVMTARIRAYDIANTTAFFDQNLTFEVDPRNILQSTAPVIDKIDIPGAYKVQVDIVSLLSNGSAVSCPPNVSLKLSVTSSRVLSAVPSLSGLQLTHELHNSNANPSLISSTQTTEHSDADYMLVKWNELDYVEGYELEWTYVDHYTSVPNTYTSDVNLDFSASDMDNNASRIFIEGNQFRIPLLYDKGYLVYRLRALYKTDCQADYYLSTNWTSSTCNTKLSCFGANYQLLAGHEQSLNWQASRSFAEGGKSKEVVSYFDGTQRNRQSIAYINSDQATLVSEQYYDYAGRPAVQALPVPGNPKIGFHPSFNQSSSQDFGPQNFDIDGLSCNVQVSAMDNTSGSSQYYSANNPNQTGANAFIPDAQGFPFSQIEYEPDNTGRIRRQGGVGAQYQLGSGHETKYFYSIPDQEELDRLFGTDVGYARYYKKVLVIDPNGQASISYFDQTEKVIATALTGNVPIGIAALNGGIPPLSSIDMLAKSAAGDADDQEDQNFVMSDSLGLEMNYHMVYPANDNFLANYNLVSLPPFTDDCFETPTQYQPIVNVDVSLIDDACQIPLFTDNQTFGTYSRTASSPTTGTISIPNIPSLDLGSYRVGKTLRIDEDAMEQYAEDYIADNTCLIPFSTFLTNAQNALNYDPCDEFFTAPPATSIAAYNNCIQELGSPSNYASQQVYDELLEECLEPYSTPKTCEMIYETMLMDVSPGGQYGSFEVDANGNYYSEDPLSVFNDNSNSDHTNVLPVYINGQTGPSYPSGITNVNDLIANWDQSYAHDLVKDHPEYQYYIDHYQEYCDETVLSHGINTQEYDYLLSTVLTRADLSPLNDYYKIVLANNGSFNLLGPGLSPTNFPILNEDPYFNQGSLPADVQAHKTALQAALEDINGTGMDLYEYAAFMAQCGNWHGNNSTACSYTSFGVSTDPTIQQKEWKFLHSMYISLKQEVIYNWANEEALDINNLVTGAGHCNVAIGEQDFHGPPYLLNRYKMIAMANGTNFPSNLNSYTSARNAAYNQTIIGIHADIYEEKQKRFAFNDPYLLNNKNQNASEDDVYQEIYAETGLCPLAHNLQYFLDDVFINHDPKSTFQMLEVDGFSTKLYEQLSGLSPYTNYNYTAYEWTGTVQNSGTRLKVDFNFGHSDLIRIDFDANSNFNWTSLGSSFEIVEVISFVPDPSLNSGTRFGFAMELKLKIISTSAIVKEVVTGTIDNVDLQNCSGLLSNQPHSNPVGSSFEGLLNLLVLNGDLTSATAVDLLSSTYKAAFTASLRPVLESTAGKSLTSFSWNHLNNTEFYITTNDPNVSFRLLFCAGPSFGFGFSDYYFDHFKLIDPALSPSCSGTSNTPNFQVNTTRVSFTGVNPNYPVLQEEGLFGYLDMFDANPLGGGAPIALKELDLGYVGRPLAADPGFTQECERLKPARLALQDLLSTALALPYSDVVYNTASSLNIMDPILFDQLDPVNWLPGAANIGSTVTYYSSFESQFNPSAYFGIFYEGHGQVFNPAMNYNNETGLYEPELAVATANTDGLYDCQVEMHFVDQNAAYNFDDVTALSNLQGLPGTFTNGLTNQFSAWVLIPATGWLEVHGSSCFQISECTICTPVPLPVPTNCWDDFSSYQSNVETPLGLDAISEEDYCAMNIVVLDDYIDYLQRMNISNTNSPYFVSLADFNNQNLDFYLSAYFDYMPIILGGGTSQNFSGFLPSSYSGQFTLLQDFAFAGVSSSCVSTFSSYLSGNSNPLDIIGYCSGYNPEYPCLRYPTSDFPNIVITGNPCDENLDRVAMQNALIAYNDYLDEVKDDFKIRYREHILSTAVETFVRECTGSSDEHFMLYYYDQAGNLIKTVPPNAVEPLAQVDLASVRTKRDLGSATELPLHKDALSTTYAYNSLNQVVSQTTPDGGISKFWYDQLGRIVCSQNAEQASKLPPKYSYTMYDNLGRVEESGQFSYSGTEWTIVFRSKQADFPRNLNSGDLEEVVHTFYDFIPAGFTAAQNYYQDLDADFSFEQLQNRVAFSASYDLLAGGGSAQTNTNYQHATFYSYDIHGNVKTLVQDFQGHFAGSTNNLMRFKRIDYYYDLVSGNVNSLVYQENMPDQFMHRYEYDGDNRITEVYTSLDGLTWDLDADYDYMAHGPLARKTLGQAQVQGEDYAYTLQGWLKGVNSSILSKDYDMGSDAVSNHVARDAFGFSLHYNSTDYTPISGNAQFLADVSNLGTANLYNGNIPAMVTSFWDNTENPVKSLANRYKYDQLNRLVESDAYFDRSTGFDLVQMGNSFNSASNNGDYRLRLTYDKNGNILSLNRKGFKTGTGTQGMDNLSYKYNTNTNQLNYVSDAAPVGNYSNDIDGQSAHNYEYDQVGNLIKDVEEEIESIEWTLSGKVKAINRSASSNLPDLEFTYDPLGNRTSKRVVQPLANDISSFYVRDASGNVLATYSITGENQMEQDEWYIYGSDRLGSLSAQQALDPGVVTTGCGPAMQPQALGQFSTYRYWEPCYTINSVQYSESYLEVASGGGTEKIRISAIGGSLTLIAQTGTFTDLGSGNSHTSLILQDGESRLISYVNPVTISPNAYYDITALSTHVNHDFAGSSLALNSRESYDIDQKRYELKNHLGNVLAVVADYKYWRNVTDESYLIQEDLSQSAHFDNYQAIGAADLESDPTNQILTVTSTEPETGVEREFSLSSSCDYEICVTISELEGRGPFILSIVESGTEHASATIEEPGEYCFTLSLNAGNYSMQILNMDAEGFFTISNFQIIQSCTASELVADVLNSQDYYPFGATMSGRSFNSGDYRYGFGNQEVDNEIKGVGNSLNFKFRIYDPRLGKFLSVDPLTARFPMLTPYQYASNSPIASIDVDGAEGLWYIYAKAGVYGETTTKIVNGTEDGIKASVTATLNFVTNDAWKAQTWKEAGMFMEEIILSSSPYSGIYNPNTPRLDSAVQSFEDDVINGDAYTRSKFASGLVTDVALGMLGDKGLSKLRSLKVFTNVGKTFRSTSIRFSQSSVNGYGKAVDALKSGNYDPIDVVQMQDGMYTTVDNTRLLAAQNEGLNISANVHKYTDALPESMLERFENPNQAGQYAKTWGEAVEYRTNSQNASYRENYGGTGSFVQPQVNSQ